MKRFILFLMIGMGAQMLCADIWEDLAKYKMGDEKNPPPVAINELIVKTPADQMGPVEEKLIAIAESPEATPEARWFACRMLQRVGTERCVPALAKLLCDDTLSHYARLKLERLPESQAAGAALRDALDKAPDQLKVGIIGTLAERGDQQAVKAIAKLAESDNAELAIGALQALGKIGGKDALAALMQVKVCSTPNLEQGKLMADGGSFFSVGGEFVADALESASVYALLQAAAGVKDAGVIESVYQKSKSDLHRSAALTAMVRVDERQGASLLVQELKGDNAYMSDCALTLLREIKGGALTAAAAETLKDLPDTKKPALIYILGWRGDKGALASVQKQLDSRDAAVSKAAAGAAARLGDGDTVKVLLAHGAKEDRESVVTAVSVMTGAGVDQALIAALGDSSLSVIAAEVLTLRESEAAVPELKKLALSDNAAVQETAWKALGTIAGDKDLDDLLKMTLAVKGRKIKPYEIAAIREICSGADDKNACIRAVGAYYESADDSIRMFILDTAAAAGGGEGVKYAQSALKSDNKDLYLHAVRALSVWAEHQQVCPVLLELAKNGPEAKVRILALRGYISQEQKEGDKKKSLAMLNTAKELATRPEEKKLLIASADRWKEDFILPFIFSYVNDGEVAEDARTVLLGKAGRVRNKQQMPKEIVEALNIIVNDAASDKSMVKKAKEELAQIKKDAK